MKSCPHAFFLGSKIRAVVKIELSMYEWVVSVGHVSGDIYCNRIRTKVFWKFMSLFLADLFISERLSAFNAIIAFALFQSLKSFYETSVASVRFSV